MTLRFSTCPTRGQPWARTTTLSLALLAGLSACTRVPEIENRLTDDLRAQPYPQLLPLATALPAQAPPAQAAAEVNDDLEARARRLKARAAALRKREI